MPRRLPAALLALLLPACAPPPQPVAPAAAAIPACPADASVMDGWDERAPPQRIFGNTYYVGSCGLTALLLTSPAGHVLIDGATAAAAPKIAANIRQLGFRLEDVRYLLNSHEHADHAGGLAELQRLTGATVLARASALATLARGRSDRSDPQFQISDPFPAVAGLAPLAADGRVRLGALVLTAHASPGHAPGGTSWSWTSCENERCLHLAYADSSSAISDTTYRYLDHPQTVAAFRAGLDALAALPCDILLTPHPAASNLWPRLRGQAPLVAAGACRDYAARGRAGLAARLAKERQGTAP